MLPRKLLWIGLALVAKARAETAPYDLPFYGGPTTDEECPGSIENCEFTGDFSGVAQVDQESNTVTMTVTMKTDWTSDDQIPNGFWVGIVDRTLFCGQEGAPSNTNRCLPMPMEGSSYPSNAYFMQQASRKIYFATNGDKFDFHETCGSAVLDEFCNSRIQCENLNWNSETDRNNAFADLVNSGGYRVVDSSDDVSFSILAKNRFQTRVDRVRYRSYELQVEVTFPGDIFVKSTDIDDRFDWKVQEIEPKFLTWGLVQSTRFTNCQDFPLTDQIQTSAAIIQVLPQTSERQDLYFSSLSAPTAQPTKAPTVSPTPTPRCPDERDWEKCDRINTWWRHLIPEQGMREKRAAKLRARRNGRIERACKRAGCNFCDYDTRNAVTQCRPRKATEGYRDFTVEDVCPESMEEVFVKNEEGGCPFVDNCPSVTIMAACSWINERTDLPRYRRRVCENSFDYNGIRIPEKSCVYNLGICRAIGEDNWWARKTVREVPKFWQSEGRDCPIN